MLNLAHVHTSRLSHPLHHLPGPRSQAVADVVLSFSRMLGLSLPVLELNSTIYFSSRAEQIGVEP